DGRRSRPAPKPIGPERSWGPHPAAGRCLNAAVMRLNVLIEAGDVAIVKGLGREESRGRVHARLLASDELRDARRTGGATRLRVVAAALWSAVEALAHRVLADHAGDAQRVIAGRTVGVGEGGLARLIVGRVRILGAAGSRAVEGLALRVPASHAHD